jgi:hypothetical protein
MIVRFAVDPDALSMNGRAPEDRVATHRRLLQCWAEWGVLVFSGGTFRGSELDRAIGVLPCDLRILWRTWIKRHRHRMIAGPNWWEGLSRFQSLGEFEGLRDVLDLVCVDADSARRCGVPLGGASQNFTDRGIEIALFEKADESLAFTQAKNRSRKRFVSEGDDIHQVWNECYGGLAQISRNICIVDRYALIELVEQGGKVEPYAGLEWFLRLLDMYSVGCTVIIISCIEKKTNTKDLLSPEDISNSMGALARGLTRGVYELRLALLDRDDARNFEHYRHIRFNDSVLNFDKGVGAFTGKGKSGGRYPFSQQGFSADFREQEGILQALAMKHGEPLVFRTGRAG